MSNKCDYASYFILFIPLWGRSILDPTKIFYYHFLNPIIYDQLGEICKFNKIRFNNLILDNTESNYIFYQRTFQANMKYSQTMAGPKDA